VCRRRFPPRPWSNRRRSTIAALEMEEEKKGGRGEGKPCGRGTEPEAAGHCYFLGPPLPDGRLTTP